MVATVAGPESNLPGAGRSRRSAGARRSARCSLRARRGTLSGLRMRRTETAAMVTLALLQQRDGDH